MKPNTFVGKVGYEILDNGIKFFREKNFSNFVVIDMSRKDELKRFTNWLGIKNNKQDFSWENKSKLYI
jgi:hypothetical protein